MAQLASERLFPTGRKAVETILADQSMVDVALWADDVRDTTHRFSYRWHLVNIPITSGGYKSSRDCQKTDRGDCVVRALARLESDLKDGVLVGQEQREALMFLIHFMGDLHQPLHCGHNHDLGGNQRQITEIGGSGNLHSAWDSGIIRASGRDTDELVAAANKWASDAERGGNRQRPLRRLGE